MSISVGDKFIIEVGAIAQLPDGKKKYFIKPFESLVFDRKGLNQLEKFDTQALKEYDLGYKTAYDLAVTNAQTTKLAWGEQEYNRGLEDASKLIAYGDSKFVRACYPSDADYSLYDLNAKYGLADIVEKFKAYEEKKKAEIKVGDEVVTVSGHKGIVIKIRDKDNARILFADGCLCIWDTEDAKIYKTGKHYDIESILKELGE